MLFHVDGLRPLRGEIFVYGSNLAGRHGKGAALVAKVYYGAIYGTGECGLTNQSFAIPTKDADLKTLPISHIERSIDALARVATHVRHPDFFVTRVGCGLAGYEDSTIAPLFAAHPVLLTDRFSYAEEWAPYLKEP